MRKPHPAPKRTAAIAWLAEQPWFATWTTVPRWRGAHPAEWRQIADAVRGAGFFSFNTATQDLPVSFMVTEAIARRDARAANAGATPLVEGAPESAPPGSSVDGPRG